MKFGLTKPCLLFLTTALLLGGCVAVPDSVQVPENTPLVAYQQVVAAPDAQKDKMARWGGVIANIENKSNQTQLDVVYYPLRAYGRPIIGKESIGRFRVYVDGFLDPMVYQKGRTMTFSGNIQGIEEGLVGEHQYQYPTLQAKGYYLWEDIDRIEIETISVWPHHRYGFGHPFYGWSHWPFYQRHVIKRKRHHYHDHNSGSDSRGGNSGPSNRRHSEDSQRLESQKARGNIEP